MRCGVLSCRRIVRTAAMIVLLPAAVMGAVRAKAQSVDFHDVEVRLPRGAVIPEQSAARMLIEEVARRSGVRWTISQDDSARSDPRAILITLGTTAEMRTMGLLKAGSGGPSNQLTAAESFRIRTHEDGAQAEVIIEGHDARGVLFGVGYLLRHLEMTFGHAGLPGSLASLDTMQAPAYAVRGHQLGYRPKNNTFDGWSAQQFEQYIRDLAVFGTNTIEIIPPRSDDAPSSPLFTLPPLEMMKTLSATLDRYGLNCSIWYPAMDKDYADPATVDRAVSEWGAIFRALPRIDAVFVPGGDPGHTEPKYLFRLLEKEAAELRRYHPHAEMWVSPQSFDAAWLAEFYGLLNTHPKWLTGVVYGPEMRESPDAFRKHVPREYPIRFYPDITHTLSAQYPVPHWDPAFALTEGREPIDPEPQQQGLLFHRYAPDTIGFVAYSEGSNDDVNKILWSAWGWDPARSSDDILKEYARYFIGPDSASEVARDISGLEQDWRGPIAANRSITPTLDSLEHVARQGGSALQSNWRLQQLLYRANYDAYLQQRDRIETVQQKEALAALSEAPQKGSSWALEHATSALGAAPACADSVLCERASALAGGLFQTIRMQLSVTRYGALAVDRGANLDRIDVPLNDRNWLLQQMHSAAAHDTEAEKLQAIASIVAEEHPPDHVIADDLGLEGMHPHLLPGASFAQDPSGLTGAYFSVVTDSAAPAAPLFERAFAGTLYDLPVTMRYTHLKVGAHCSVHVLYPGDGGSFHLEANGVAVTQRCVSAAPCTESDFDLPRPIAADGTLTLQWAAPPGLGGNGRRVRISRVLLREDH
jgi:hypothetical protein